MSRMSKLRRHKRNKFRNRPVLDVLRESGYIGATFLQAFMDCPRREAYRIQNHDREWRKIMTELARHQLHTGGGKLGGLPALRVTSIAQFEQCPKGWSAKFIEGLDQGSSIYGRIGTAVHAVIESFYRYGEDAYFNPAKIILEDNTTLQSMWNIVPVNEQDNLRRYLLSLRDKGGQVLALETEFTMEMLEGALPVRGHVDVVLYHADRGLIEILDHKTNRTFESVHVWQEKLQPLLYAWMIRNTWPGYRVGFSIGYVNQDTFLEWETDPEDDVRLAERFKHSWERMVAYDAANNYPATVNENCGYCPLKDKCVVLRDSMSSFQDSALSILEEKPLHQQYLWVKNIRKIAESLEEELGARLLEKIGETRDGIELDGYLFTAGYTQRRVIPAQPAIEEVIRAIQRADPETAQFMWEFLNELATIKVTALDKLIKQIPALKAPLEQHITLHVSDKPTLRAKQVRSITS